MEARLLARESSAQIALRIGTTPESVDAYEALFFSVRERINASVYIVLAAIKKPHPAEPFAPAEERFARALAYFGGPLVLDVALAWLKLDGKSKSSNYPATLENPLADSISWLFNVYKRTAWLGQVLEEPTPPIAVMEAILPRGLKEPGIVMPLAEVSVSKPEECSPESASDVADHTCLFEPETSAIPIPESA